MRRNPSNHIALVLPGFCPVGRRYAAPLLGLSCRPTLNAISPHTHLPAHGRAHAHALPYAQ